jgi:hypothetical protein
MQKTINGIEVSVVRTNSHFRDTTPAEPYGIEENVETLNYISYMAGRKSPILITGHQPTDEELAAAVLRPKRTLNYYFSKRTLKEMLALTLLIAGVFIALSVKP